MTATRGTSVVEALVAASIAGLAAGALALAAAHAARALDTARHTALGLALCADRAEALRAGPRASGSDTVAAGGASWTRRWTTGGGRGLPAQLAVEVDLPHGRHAALATEVFP